MYVEGFSLRVYSRNDRLWSEKKLTDVCLFEGADSMQTIVPSRRRMTLRLNDENEIDVPVRDALPVTADRVRYQGFKQEKITLPAGSVRMKGAMPLPADILFIRNALIQLSDDTILYADIFLPAQEGRYPAIVCQSPFGKEIGSMNLDDFPRRLGVRLDHTSMLQTFMGPDPAYWTSHGYAVVNVDVRGAFNSDGTILFYGSQYGRDAREVIEWTASQAWCSGKVGMSGCGWLAAAQYFAAAQKPEHLAAIAPWEGLTDVYRDAMARGGIPQTEYIAAVSNCLSSSENGGIEDVITALLERPLRDEYWGDKAAELHQISIPAYLTAGYTNSIHSYGTFEAWRKIASEEKWLRIYTTNVVEDYYHPANVRDLCRFFDHYLKGENNSWQKTARVRLSVLDPGGHDVINRPEKEYPLKRTQYKKLYLNPEKGALDSMPCVTAGCDVYDSGSKKNFITYRYRLPERSEIVGTLKLHLWVCALAAEDMDLFVRVEKLNGLGMRYKGKTNSGDPASCGYLRVSLRELDETEKDNDINPHLSFLREQKVGFGEITPVDILLPPIGLVFGKGEILQLTVGAYKSPDPGSQAYASAFGNARISVPAETYTYMPDQKTKMVALGGHSREVSNDAKTAQLPKDINHGYQAIYAGGRYESYLYVPFIPEKAGEEVIL